MLRVYDSFSRQIGRSHFQAVPQPGGMDVVVATWHVPRHDLDERLTLAVSIRQGVSTGIGLELPVDGDYAEPPAVSSGSSSATTP
jgi:hypothetical protein